LEGIVLSTKHELELNILSMQNDIDRLNLDLKHASVRYENLELLFKHNEGIIKSQNREIGLLERKIETFEKIIKENNIKKGLMHNARGAGRKIKANEREILKLRNEDKMKIKDIAIKLGLGEATVKRVLAKIKNTNIISKE
jgi:DNA-directed RNA polymerase specialized sigma subunit